MSFIDTNKLIGSIKLHFPEDATEISDALDLLNLALDGLLNSANTQIAESHKNKEYDKSIDLVEFSKSTSVIQEKIIEYSTSLSVETEIEEEEPDETEEQRIIPNYSEYVVDSSIPHTLYEDFTYKRVVSFSTNNKRYPAKDWKDVLFQTCDLLAEINPSKFSEFINDPIMKGRKISYFSKNILMGKMLK